MLPNSEFSVANMSFVGKVVLLTGSSSGIGRATAKHLSQLGGHLSIVDCNADGLNSVAKEIVDAGFNPPLVTVADVTKDSNKIIAETINKFGKLDVLVNNAGVFSLTGLVDLNMGNFDHVMNTNVRSAVVLTKLAIPYLEETKGNVVNISSIAGSRATDKNLAYAMSKAAINQFTKCIASELGPKGIRVNAVNPGVTNTAMVNMVPEHIREKTLKYLKRSYPLQRIGEPDDVSRAIAYLASDNASFITGNLLYVDGGALAANVI